MIKTLQASLVALALTSTAALADTPWNTLNTYEGVSVNAPAAKVWAAVANWGALQTWCPVFEKTEIVSGGTAVGSVRAITLKGGPTFTEELLANDPVVMTYKYKIIESPLPIVEYVSSVRVFDMGNRTEIAWLSSYKRRAKDNATAENDDQAVMNLLGGVYRACLGHTKTMLETGK